MKEGDEVAAAADESASADTGAASGPEVGSPESKPEGVGGKDAGKGDAVAPQKGKAPDKKPKPQPKGGGAGAGGKPREGKDGGSFMKDMMEIVKMLLDKVKANTRGREQMDGQASEAKSSPGSPGGQDVGSNDDAQAAKKAADEKAAIKTASDTAALNDKAAAESDPNQSPGTSPGDDTAPESQIDNDSKPDEPGTDNENEAEAGASTGNEAKESASKENQVGDSNEMSALSDRATPGIELDPDQSKALDSETGADKGSTPGQADTVAPDETSEEQAGPNGP